MATEAVCVDTYYRVAPPLHYVISADDVTETGSNVVGVGRHGQWSSQRQLRDLHRDLCAAGRHRLTTHGASSTACRRKLSVDDGPSCRQQVAVPPPPPPPAAAAAAAGVRRRPVDVISSTEDWTQARRRSSAWSPAGGGSAWSTLSRTMSEHTLDRGTTCYRATITDCRDDVLDEWSFVNARDDPLDDTFFSPPKIAPISGQLSLVCISI